MEIKKGSFLYVAEKKLDIAKILFSHDLDEACIQCQQCIEKSLKAVIEARGEKPPYVHNLNVLAEKSGMELLKEFDSDLRFINSTYFDLSYPSSYAPVTEKSAKIALSVAEDIYNKCKVEVSRIQESFEPTDLFKD